MFPRVRAVSLLILLGALLLTGCLRPPRRAIAGAGTPPEELTQLQAQLAELTTNLEDLTRRMEELDTRTQALADELTRARQLSPLAPLEPPPSPTPAPPKPTPEPMEDFPVTSISLGMLTGGANWDAQPGDDGVVVYLYPLDRSGDEVKRAGDCTFELFDLSQKPSPLLMSWHIPAAEAATLWQSFPGCYRFTLAWRDSPPRTSEPILKATFVTLSGQEFTATKELRVELPPAGEEGK